MQCRHIRSPPFHLTFQATIFANDGFVHHGKTKKCRLEPLKMQKKSCLEVHFLVFFCLFFLVALFHEQQADSLEFLLRRHAFLASHTSKLALQRPGDTNVNKVRFPPPKSYTKICHKTVS